MKNILITGGAGFIGSHLVRLLVNKYPQYHIINLDALTYAGNLENLNDIAGKPNYSFVQADICEFDKICELMQEYCIDGVIHLAAESHVDRSIDSPFLFARTNVIGTLNLLEAARRHWNDCFEGKKFHHVSTDEVYGALPISEHCTQPPFGPGIFHESTAYAPHSPYSASKAGGDHFVRAYHDTYGLPTVITNCSNNYGPFQFPEKLIPLTIYNRLHNIPVPVYGTGCNVRDWLYVEDHARAIDCVFHHARPGATYNVGGFNEWRNIDIVRMVLNTVDQMLDAPPHTGEKLISFVRDRAGHDLRYAIDSSKLQKDFNWTPGIDIQTGITHTVQWYLANQDWLRRTSAKAHQPSKKA